MEYEEENEYNPRSQSSSDNQNHQQSSPPPPSPSLSPSSQPVTVAAVGLPSHHSLTLALPIQQPRVPNTGGGREDCWSEGATSTLIDAWGERYLELSRGNLKQKHWKEVADVVTSREDYTKAPKTDIQCKNRIDTLKKKYKIEKSKIVSGLATKWVFFDRIEELIGPVSRKNEDNDEDHKSNKHGYPSGSLPKIPAVRSIRSSRQQFRVKQRDSSNSADGDSSDSFPPRTTNVNGKRWRFERKPPPVQTRRVEGELDPPMKELSRAIVKFGEMYEKVERSKLEQVVEMERQRMEFTRDLELQRMRFFMKTQMELSQLNHGRRVAVGNGRHNSNNGG
ncbi:trihelix transcription factor ASIL2-like [Macadamia integrifolia]|uniref:trihelix transcription factor ASIL2-like n=1 Tax=Macadamia integrifolia TaxID=60698 RepID=UPI001C4E59A6|nr:trihelix transcription factor ASIL2-like [Macadamia integrifolia]